MGDMLMMSAQFLRFPPSLPVKNLIRDHSTSLSLVRPHQSRRHSSIAPFTIKYNLMLTVTLVFSKHPALVALRYKGCLDFPCYCLCFEPVKARRQKPALMVCPHAGLPG